MLCALSVPAENERGPLYMDQVLAALHQGNPRRLSVTLGVTRHAGEVTLCCWFPAALRGLLEGQFYAQYPEAKIVELPDEVIDPAGGMEVWTADLCLTHDLFPIKRYIQFEDALNRQAADPVSAIVNAVAGNAQWAPVIEVIIRPARRTSRARARRCLRRLARPFFHAHHRLAKLYLALAMSHVLPLRVAGWCLGRLARHGGPSELKPLDTSASRQHDREEDLQAASDKAGRLLFETHIRLRVTATQTAGDSPSAALREIAGAFGQFNSRHASFHLRSIRRGSPRRFFAPPFLLSAEEVATLWHPATAGVHAPGMTTVQSREAEPPVQLPTPEAHPGLAVLGLATFRSEAKPCGILPDDRRRHLYTVGKTGMGKSTLLHQLIATDIAAGHGVGLLDPHGQLADAVLASIPSRRTNDVIFFDAGDKEFPLAFNILACMQADQRPLVASGVIAAFKRIWGDFFGPRMEHIFRNALLALLEVPGTTLLSVLRLLSEAAYRQAILRQVTDRAVLNFWEREFGSWNSRLQAEYVAPIQNKVGAFVSNPLLRNIVGQTRSTIDVRKIMDEGKVLIVNLSKGRIGDDASSLLGSFLVTAIQLAAMSRAELPEEQRKDFYLYVDEFQNYATDSFATILSEARKYRLNLTMAHQYLEQVPEETLAAVFGNVGTAVVFQVGAKDAEILAEELGGGLTAQDLLQLNRYHSYVRLLIDGHPSRPFSLQTLPPPGQDDHKRPSSIRRYTRYRYARPAERVEQEIAQAFAAV